MAQIDLSGNLTIRTAEEIRHRLLDAVINNDSLLLIDCSAATEVDLTFIQILKSARLSALARGQDVRLAFPASGPLLETLQRGGFVSEDSPSYLADDNFWLASDPVEKHDNAPPPTT